MAFALTGISLHLDGELGRARRALEAALCTAPTPGGTTTNYLGFDGRQLAGVILARTLWLQGHPDQAMDRALVTIADAEALDHPLTLSITLVWAVSVFLWIGDLNQAAHQIDRLFARARIHSLSPYLAVGHGFRGEIAIRRGDPEDGIRILQQSLAELRAAPYELLTTPLNIALIQGFVATRRFAEADGLLKKTIHAVATNGERCYVPELLRMKARLTTMAPQSFESVAEVYLFDSLEASRRQGARAWELRSAIDLASLYADRGERNQARALLEPVFDRFSEGLKTADLKAAVSILSG